jgi:hypothetical protein
MKGIRFAVYLAAGFILSSCLIILLGESGLVRYRALSDYREELERNIAELELLHQDLLQDLEALGSDPERIALQARQLGYFREEERLIRLEGYNPPKSVYKVGKIIRRLPASPGRGADRLLRLLGAGAAVCLTGLSVWRRRIYAGRK